jgi:hypothetical protein
MFLAWYQPEYHMAREDWLYCGGLLLASVVAFGVGLLLGLAWAHFL